MDPLMFEKVCNTEARPVSGAVKLHRRSSIAEQHSRAQMCFSNGNKKVCTKTAQWFYHLFSVSLLKEKL